MISGWANSVTAFLFNGSSSSWKLDIESRFCLPNKSQTSCRPALGSVWPAWDLQLSHSIYANWRHNDTADVTMLRVRTYRPFPRHCLQKRSCCQGSPSWSSSPAEATAGDGFSPGPQPLFPDTLSDPQGLSAALQKKKKKVGRRQRKWAPSTTEFK